MTFSAQRKPRTFIAERRKFRARVRTDMKNPDEVLRRKEAELERLQEEVEALRLVGKLLSQRSVATQQETETRGKILQMP